MTMGLPHSLIPYWVEFSYHLCCAQDTSRLEVPELLVETLEHAGTKTTMNPREW